MSKIAKILDYTIKGMTLLVLTIITSITLLMAYIMFAPDHLPKPFRLVYDYVGVPIAAIPGDQQSPSTTTPTNQKSEEIQPGQGIMFNMSTKIINLADPTGRKYIRVSMVLEFAPDNLEYEALPEEEKNSYLTSFQDEINARMPIMDDVVITLLSTKTFDQLYTADGKEALRKEVLEAIANRMPDYHILSVYFTEFVVQ